MPIPVTNTIGDNALNSNYKNTVTNSALTDKAEIYKTNTQNITELSNTPGLEKTGISSIISQVGSDIINKIPNIAEDAIYYLTAGDTEENNQKTLKDLATQSGTITNEINKDISKIKINGYTEEIIHFTKSEPTASSSGAIDRTNDVVTTQLPLRPTMRNLINFYNKGKEGDKKGDKLRYYEEDFRYCKYFGKIPNNYMVTLVRYTNPVNDNGEYTKNGIMVENDRKEVEGVKKQYPEVVAKAITYIGRNTKNTLGYLLNIHTGFNWTSVSASEGESLITDSHLSLLDITSISTTLGLNKQGGGEKSTSNNYINSFLTKVSGSQSVSGEGIGKFGDIFKSIATKGAEIFSMFEIMKMMGKRNRNGEFDIRDQMRVNEDAYDPFAQGNIFSNKSRYGVNLISSTFKRAKGFKETQQFDVTFSFKTHAFGTDIYNPKIAMLDIINNMMQLTTSNAEFFGGVNRYAQSTSALDISTDMKLLFINGNPAEYIKVMYDLFKEGVKDAVRGVLQFGKDVAKVIGVGVKSSLKTKKSNASTQEDIINVIQTNANTESGISTIEGNNVKNNHLDSLGIHINNANSGKDNLYNTTEINGTVEDTTDIYKLNLSKKQSDRLIPQITKVIASAFLEGLHWLPKPNQGVKSILTGFDVGEWRLIIGNPFNPIAQIGNLICTNIKMEIPEKNLDFNDFPEEINFVVTLQNARTRDKRGITNMFGFFARDENGNSIQTKAEKTSATKDSIIDDSPERNDMASVFKRAYLTPSEEIEIANIQDAASALDNTNEDPIAAFHKSKNTNVGNSLGGLVRDPLTGKVDTKNYNNIVAKFNNIGQDFVNRYTVFDNNKDSGTVGSGSTSGRLLDFLGIRSDSLLNRNLEDSMYDDKGTLDSNKVNAKIKRLNDITDFEFQKLKNRNNLSRSSENTVKNYDNLSLDYDDFWSDKPKDTGNKNQ